jgi:hypothetical protein
MPLSGEAELQRARRRAEPAGEVAPTHPEECPTGAFARSGPAGGCEGCYSPTYACGCAHGSPSGGRSRVGGW